MADQEFSVSVTSVETCCNVNVCPSEYWPWRRLLNPGHSFVGKLKLRQVSYVSMLRYKTELDRTGRIHEGATDADRSPRTPEIRIIQYYLDEFVNFSPKTQLLKTS